MTDFWTVLGHPLVENKRRRNELHSHISLRLHIYIIWITLYCDILDRPNCEIAIGGLILVSRTLLRSRLPSGHSRLFPSRKFRLVGTVPLGLSLSVMRFCSFVILCLASSLLLNLWSVPRHVLPILSNLLYSNWIGVSLSRPRLVSTEDYNCRLRDSNPWVLWGRGLDPL
jgi:hypothetical protein